MESTGLKVEKLRDHDNWQQWRFVIRTLLEEDDLALDVCEGNIDRPDDTAENAKSLQKYKTADKKARKLIVTTIEKKPMQLIMSCNTAREMRLKLNTVYNSRSDENLSIVQKQFLDFKWIESESVAHNLPKLEQLCAKLKALDSEVKKSMVITRVLSSLPNKFRHFHSAWDSVADDKKKLEILTSKLMAEELRIPESEELKQSTALCANYDVKSDANRKKFNKKIVCFNCGKPNHYKKDCFRCFICKEKGHRSNQCNKKPQNHAEQQQ